MPKSTKNTARTQADTHAEFLLLAVATFALSIIGIVMVYSVTSANLASEGQNPYSDVLNQVVYIAAGIALAILIWRFLPPSVWNSTVIWLIWGISVALILATFAFGEDINGAKRWLYIGNIGIQPSEFVKVGLMLVSVKIISDAHDGAYDLKTAFVRILIFVIVPLAFQYLWQSDLGTTLICVVGIFAVAWIGGVPFRILGMAGAAVVVLGVAAILGTGYRSNRLVYLDPWNDGMGGLGDGYNIIRSYYALSEGGIFGVGIGNSHEKYQYLRNSDTDFIFSIIGEEMGLIGALLVIGLFLAILYAGLRICRNSSDSFSSMIAGGFTIMLVFQAFLNIGCAIGVFPTTGKPLPFISAGGSSMLSSYVQIGLILSVHRMQESSRQVLPARAHLRDRRKA